MNKDNDPRFGPKGIACPIWGPEGYEEHMKKWEEYKEKERTDMEELMVDPDQLTDEEFDRLHYRNP